MAILICSRLYAGAAQVSFVPWKVLEPGMTPDAKAFTLFWIPASPGELRHSDLITSERLTLYADRCIGMQIVRDDDSVMLEKLQATDGHPLAILVEGGREVARVAGESGVLAASAVESMVRQAYDTRQAALDAAIDLAGSRAAAGDRAAAIALYRQVAAEGCAFPRPARTAQRALRRLGVKR